MILLCQFLLLFKCEIAEITGVEQLQTKLNNFILFNLFYTKKYRLILFSTS